MPEDGVFLAGRQPAEWPTAARPTSDKFFAAIRKDDVAIDGLEFQHCTFVNLSFKESKIEQCRFTDCVFIRCYFRKTRLVSSSFVGCKFINCDFPKTTVQSCDFRYSHFEVCAVSFAEMEHSLPREPNLREELAWRLAMSSDEIGEVENGRRYRLAAIEARQEHLLAAVMSKSDWYRSHYPGLRRLQALVSFLSSTINGLVWGHGEKPMILLRNLLVLSLIIFPSALWLVREDLANEVARPALGDLVWLSVTTLIPLGGSSIAAVGWTARTILALESLVGVVAAGLLVAILVKRLIRR